MDTLTVGVERDNPSGWDALGRPLADGYTPLTWEIDAVLAPGPSEELIAAGRSTEHIAQTLYGAYDADIAAGDRVIVDAPHPDAGTYHVHGRPLRWHGAFDGNEYGLVAALGTAAEGGA